jgi:endonuclease YncB( thermonuclease family)
MIKQLLFLFLTIPFSISVNNIQETNNYPKDFLAKVIGVKDGDTIEVLFNEVPIIIRLEHIDCPERKQPYGKKAKQFVSNLVFGKTVRILSKGKKDRWGRLIAVIKINESNLNKELVKNGLAMHFKKYSKDQSYDIIEIRAKKNKIGMWSQPKVIAPWIFRKG